jgi:hypothetical protein
MLRKPVDEGAHATVVAFLHRVSTRDVLQTLALPLDHCTTPDESPDDTSTPESLGGSPSRHACHQRAAATVR